MINMNITVLSIHSCYCQKIGIGKSGGLSIYLYNLVDFLLSKKVKVNFITSYHENCLLEKNVNLNIIHSKNSNLSDSKIFSVSNKTDLLISNYWTSGIFAKKFFNSSKIKKINISHTIESLKKVNNPTYQIDKFRYEEEKMFSDFFDYVLCFSKQEKELLKKDYGYLESQILDSTPGYNQNFFYNMSKQYSRIYINFHQKDELILFVGRLDYLKGLDIALDVMRLSKIKSKNYKLLIAGGDIGSIEQKKIIEELKMNKINDSIFWLGSLTQKDLNYYYNAVDIVLIPSRSETFGMVCLEAIATKTPVLASPVGRMKDFIDNGNSGILVEKNTSQEYFSNLEIFFENKDFYKPNLEKVGTFQWNKVLSKTFDIFI